MRVWQYIECALPFFNEAVWNARSDLAPSTPWIWRRSREICSIYICTRRKLNFCPFSDRFRDFTLWFTFMVHKKCVCLPALKTHKTTFLGGRTWNDTSFTKEILFLGGQKMKIWEYPLCDKHIKTVVVCPAFCSRKLSSNFRQKSRISTHVKCNPAELLRWSILTAVYVLTTSRSRKFLWNFFFNFLGILNWKISVNAKEIFHPIYFSCGIFFKMGHSF